MKLRFYACKKCEEHYAGVSEKEDILCGALVGWVNRNGSEVPVGCGGTLLEETEEEAREAAYSKRDSRG